MDFSTLILTTKHIPSNEGMIKFITHKQKVAAKILNLLASNMPQIWMATSPLASRSHIGGKGIPVCIKNIPDMLAAADTNGTSIPKKYIKLKYCKL